MIQTNARILLSVIFATTTLSCSNDPDSPLFAAANTSDNCEFFVIGTSEPPSSGTPAIISDVTGTVISANFFDSGAIDQPYFDGNESVSVCVRPLDTSGNRTAEITTDVGLDNDFNIKAYPQFIIGSKFGNIFETSFRFYSNTGLPVEDQWPVTSTNFSDSGTPFEFANLEYVSEVRGVGLPAFTNNLPEISITLDIDETNIVGAERDIMLESWFFDTSANASIIGNNVATGLPIANTLNNIVGVGHPHFDELDNTLLEMMVHVGPLSPNDVSSARNNPGQNQLTEVFSGSDFDLDGIDDHFDVDSHNFIDSINPEDPKPGLYSSGIDSNVDGIDDADLLPVQVGEHLYSIWYGESFLSPIVIYSRETDTSLQNDFDPNTPDMNLSTEGEITLPWNEFLEFTLADIQPLLQSASVPWATGENNIFERMSADGGAIGGVEFGVEPQINNAADQPYIISINKFEVQIDGNSLGLESNNTDTEAPTTEITSPASQDTTLQFGTSFSGSAADSGGSGLASVRVAIRDRDTELWVDFTSAGSNSDDFTFTNASLTNTSTNWQLNHNLPAGNYVIFVKSFDNAGNSPVWATRRFSIAPIDNDIPTAEFTTPAAQDAVLQPGTSISGTASDTEGSGFNQVRVAIRNSDTGLWIDFTSGSDSDDFTFTDATLTNTSNISTNWQLNHNLPTGNYVVFVKPFDNAGNSPVWATRRFSIAPIDNDIPAAEFTTPAAQDAVLQPGTSISGTASDTGGSGFNQVRVAIRNSDTGLWIDFNSDSDSDDFTFTDATLTNTSNTTSDWQLNHNLSTGNYVIFIKPFDNAGNSPVWMTRRFSITPSVSGNKNSGDALSNP